MSKPPLWKVLGPLVVVIPYFAWVLNDRFTDDYVRRDIKIEQRRAELASMVKPPGDSGTNAK